VAEGTDGTLYGSNIGMFDGEIYQISTNGIFTVLLYFSHTNGSSPCGGLVLGDGGKLLGVTAGGGTNDQGTVFSMTASLAPVITSVSKTNNTVELHWRGLTGSVYQVQYANDLSSTNWTNLTSFMSPPFETTTNYDSIPAGVSQRFYRVVLLQFPQ
jgi:hypothetical protein